MTKGNTQIPITNVIQCFFFNYSVFHKEFYLKFAYLRKDSVPYVKAPRRKEVWGSEETDPRILNLRIELGVCSISRSDHFDHLSDMSLSHRASNEEIIPDHCCRELPGKERSCLLLAFDSAD
jgi:hypothetical protein